jgi:hypothetical protein
MQRGVFMCAWCYVAQNRDRWRRLGTSACHLTHQDFSSVECVIFIMMILSSYRRMLYVKFQIIFPRFHFPVHCRSFIIYHTLSSALSLPLRVGHIRLSLQVYLLVYH